MTHAALAHDQLDDRRELVTLLNALPPRRRVAWLAWCCRQATVPNSKVSPAPGPDVYRLAEQARWDDEASRKLTQDIYTDCHVLAHQYDLNLTAALLRLESLARRGRP